MKDKPAIKKLEMNDIREVLTEEVIPHSHEGDMESFLSSVASSHIDVPLLQALEKLNRNQNSTSIINDGIVGISLSVFNDKTGSPFVATAGYDSLDKGKKHITHETCFNIGSVSKFLIMILLCKLEEAKQISFDETISAYLPEIEIPNSDKIKIMHLLGHHSGLKDNGFIAYKKTDALSTLLNKEDYRMPGEKFIYSNVNFVILSLIIEKITNKSLEQVFDELIKQSLGIKNTWFITEETTQHNVAIGYKLDADSLRFDNATDWYIWGATNVRSCPSDLTIIIKNFFENDQFIPDATRQRIIASCKDVMFEVFIRDTLHSWPACIGYGLEKHMLDGTVLYGHGGWQDSNAAFLVYFPAMKTAYCITCSKTQGVYNLRGALKKEMQQGRDKKSVSALIKSKQIEHNGSSIIDSHGDGHSEFSTPSNNS